MSVSYDVDVIDTALKRIERLRKVLKKAKRLPEAKRKQMEAQIAEDEKTLKDNGFGTSNIVEPPPTYPKCDPDPAALGDLRISIATSLFFPDRHLLDFICGVICANGFVTEPMVWGVIVEPPAQGKTDLLDGVSALSEAYVLGRVTGATFRSAYKPDEGEEMPPKLLDILNGRLAVWPEFTNVLTMQSADQMRVLTDLREIYDGKAPLVSGSGAQDMWKGRFGLLVGCTGAYDRASSIRQQLGERFIVYRPVLPESEETRVKIKHTRSTPSTVKKESVARAFKAWRDKVGAIPTLQDVAITDDQYDIVSLLATMTAEARTAVTGNDDPDPEGPGRLIKQFHALAAGVAVANGRRAITDHDLDVIRRVTQSTMPTSRRRFLKALIELEPLRVSFNAMVTRMEAGKKTAYNARDELVALGILEKDGGIAPLWRDRIVKTALFSVPGDQRVLKEVDGGLVEGNIEAVERYIHHSGDKRPLREHIQEQLDRARKGSSGDSGSDRS
jgi:hypothetical protein